MMSTVSYLITMAGGMFWIFRVVVALLDSMQKDFPIKPLNPTIEIILLISVAFIPFDYVANTIISFICAMQVESFRKFHGNAYATTMCTGNLRSGTEKLVIFIRNKDKKHLKIAFQYYFIILIFCLGATIGGLITLNMGLKAVLIAIIPLILALIVMSYE